MDTQTARKGYSDRKQGRKQGVTRSTAPSYNEVRMSPNVPPESQFALAGMLVALFGVSAPPLGSIAFASAPQFVW
jgi:hypothetical protein